MPIVLLIRHGENDYVRKNRLAGRKPGVHLNEAGHAQAQAVAEILAGAPIKAVYSSPIERAIETAEPIAQALKLEVIPRDGLMETDYGDWQDKTLKSLRRRKLWKVVQGRPSMARFPQGESFAEAQLRICQEIQALVAKHGERDILVCVSHADPIKLAVAYFIGMPLDNFQRLAVSPASITALVVGEGFSHLMNLNYNQSFQLPRPEAPKPRKAPSAGRDKPIRS